MREVGYTWYGYGKYTSVITSYAPMDPFWGCMDLKNIDLYHETLFDGEAFIGKSSMSNIIYMFDLFTLVLVFLLKLIFISCCFNYCFFTSIVSWSNEILYYDSQCTWSSFKAHQWCQIKHMNTFWLKQQLFTEHVGTLILFIRIALFFYLFVVLLCVFLLQIISIGNQRTTLFKGLLLLRALFPLMNLFSFC